MASIAVGSALAGVAICFGIAFLILKHQKTQRSRLLSAASSGTRCTPCSSHDGVPRVRVVNIQKPARSSPNIRVEAADGRAAGNQLRVEEETELNPDEPPKHNSGWWLTEVECQSVKVCELFMSCPP
jgi:hypothetical protein